MRYSETFLMFSRSPLQYEWRSGSLDWMREQEAWSMLLLSSCCESRLLSSDSDRIRSTRLMSSSELSRSTNFSVFFCTDEKENTWVCSFSHQQSELPPTSVSIKMPEKCHISWLYVWAFELTWGIFWSRPCQMRGMWLHAHRKSRADDGSSLKNVVEILNISYHCKKHYTQSLIMCYSTKITLKLLK